MSLLEKASLIVTPNAYKESILYSVVPNTTLGDMTVVRATTATRVNSVGLIESVGVNVPRIDYTNGSCPSLLVEPQRTNLITYSNTFTNSAWDKGITTINANVIISPDGTLNASKLSDTLQGNNAYRLYNSVTLSAQSYTQTFYAKAAEYNWCYVRIGNDLRAWFNVSNGTVGQVTIGLTGSIISVGNGWYKITCTITTASAGGGFALIGLCTGNGIESYTPTTGEKGIYIYGAQLEAGSYATSYVPTVATSVTRNADVISKTGISSLIGQTEGTLFVDLKNAYNGWITLSDNSDANGVLLSFSKEYSTLNYFIYANSVDIIGTGFVALPSEPMKLAFKYKSGEIKLFVNGVLAYTNTATFSFSNNLNFFGNRFYWGGGLFEGSINSEQLYKTALTDAECINLTTL